MLAWAGGWGEVSGLASYYIAASIVSAGRHLDCSTHVGVSWEGVGAGAEGGGGEGGVAVAEEEKRRIQVRFP